MSHVLKFPASDAATNRMYCVVSVDPVNQGLVLLHLQEGDLFAPLNNLEAREIGDLLGLGARRFTGLIGEATVGPNTVLSVFMASSPEGRASGPLVIEDTQLKYASGDLRRYGETPMSLLSKLNSRDSFTDQESRYKLACALVLASKGLLGALL